MNKKHAKRESYTNPSITTKLGTGDKLRPEVRIRKRIGQALSQAGEREEKGAVHEDVTEGPLSNTTIFVKVTPSPIQATGLEVPLGACIGEVPKKTAGVRLQSTICSRSKSTKPNPYPTIMILYGAKCLRYFPLTAALSS